MDFEAEMWSSSAITDLALSETFLLLLSIAGYIAILFLAILYISHQLKQNKWEMALVFFISSFAVGWLVANANELSGMFIQNLMGEGIAAENLVAATGAAIEEILKLFFVYLICKSFNRRDLGFVFLTGCLVGLGFQLTEDISYVFGASNTGECLTNLISRFSGAFTSHWMYTGVTAYGLYHIFNKNKRGWFLLAAVTLLHALWNSTLNSGTAVSAFLSVVIAYLFIACVKELWASSALAYRQDQALKS